MNETEKSKILDGNKSKMCILQNYKKNDKRNNQFNNTQGTLKQIMQKSYRNFDTFLMKISYKILTSISTNAD